MEFTNRQPFHWGTPSCFPNISPLYPPTASISIVNRGKPQQQIVLDVAKICKLSKDSTPAKYETQHPTQKSCASKARKRASKDAVWQAATLVMLRLRMASPQDSCSSLNPKSTRAAVGGPSRKACKAWRCWVKPSATLTNASDAGSL